MKVLSFLSIGQVFGLQLHQTAHVEKKGVFDVAVNSLTFGCDYETQEHKCGMPGAGTGYCAERNPDAHVAVANVQKRCAGKHECSQAGRPEHYCFPEGWTFVQNGVRQVNFNHIRQPGFWVEMHRSVYNFNCGCK